MRRKVARPAGVGTTDERLFELLKELRQKEAKKKSLPPFVIFLETSLQDMATLYPLRPPSSKNVRGLARERRFAMANPLSR